MTRMSLPAKTWVILLPLCAVWAAPVALAADAPVQGRSPWIAEVRPLLERYCVDCHDGPEPSGGIDLGRLRSHAGAVADRGLWERVLLQVGDRAMPPEGNPQPNDDERATLIRWAERDVLGIDPDHPRAGRVTIRRLNRSEYRNTIRDLVGIDFEPAADFPADDVGYGFDNIGDVLSLPPLLMEKYVAAAQEIVDRALVVPRGQTQRYEAETGDHGNGGIYDGFAYSLYSNGTVSGEFDLPDDGDYLVRVRAFGQQAGDEACRLGLEVDGREVEQFEVPATQDEPQVCERRGRLPGGRLRIGAAFLNDYYRPNAPDRRDRDRNLVIDYIEVEGPLGADVASLPDSHRRLLSARPQGDDELDCARLCLEQFVTRAYRRPPQGDEIDRLTELARLALEERVPFEEAMKLPLAAVLCSPHFLFRVEPDRPGDGADGSYALDDFELATRLSYFLWSSMPDAELFALARTGRLRQPGVLDTQVSRMLHDPRAQSLVQNFAAQWLQLRNLRTFDPDRQRFPDFDEDLRAAMLRETELFFAEIVRQDRSVLDFLDADYTFVNERLARHYGIPGIQGPQFHRVELPDDRRGGVLTQASVLAVTSNPTRTSPVKRGKWVLENLLGTPPPPPPPGAGDLPEEQVLTGTLRQKMEQHRENPNWAVCHTKMDPLGFGLENFDAIGAWRDTEGDFAIDSTGELPSGETFAGPAELRTILLARKSRFVRCLAQKLLTYALGRGLEYYDRPTVDRLSAAVEGDDYRFSSLVLAIIHSDPFQRREGPGETP
jgi:hypothetical protein